MARGKKKAPKKERVRYQACGKAFNKVNLPNGGESWSICTRQKGHSVFGGHSNKRRD